MALLHRRSFLAGLAVCPLTVAARAEGTRWSYEDAARWGTRDPAAQACALGAEQSPIDLSGAVKADIHAPKIAWKPQSFEIVNDGHTIVADAEPGGVTMVDGRKYELKQIFFHTPSEHAIDGERRAMEAQFLHVGDNDEILALAALMIAGAPNKAFSAVMDAAPKETGKSRAKAPIDPIALLPKSRKFYRYQGSLTAPPCAETVSWNVFATPVEVATDDIAAFEALFQMNARPLQERRRRFVLRD